MPELPEVETVRSGLEKLLVGRSCTALEQLWSAAFSAQAGRIETHLIGQPVCAIRRLGKGLLIDLSNQWCLVVHLKMTGQLVFVDPDNQDRFAAGHPSDSLVDQLPDRSTRLVFSFGKAKLYFNDQRKFGWVKLLSRHEAAQLPFFAALGPDALAPSLDADSFLERFSRKKGSPIKAALLDQTIVAGVGNIYADEALWGAEIHPSRTCSSIQKPEWVRLFTALQAVLRLSIAQGGSTNRNYVDAEGKRGAYLDFAAVYNRQGKACKRCGQAIQKIRVAGRGTHICTNCQPEPNK